MLNSPSDHQFYETGVDLLSPSEQFLQKQVDTFGGLTKKIFSPAQIKQLMTYINVLRQAYEGEFRKLEFVDEAKKYKKPSLSHQIQTVIDLLRDRECLHTIHRSDFVSSKQYAAFEIYESYMKNTDFLFGLCVTTLFHDDIEKQKIYPITLSGTTISPTLHHPTSSFEDQIQALMATDEREGFFDELTKKGSENTTLFFAKHPDERRSSQQLSAFSIALLFHAAGHTREQIHFYLDNIIYLSYPETDADRTTGERILLVNPNKYYKTIDEIPDEKQRAMVYLTKAREQKYNSQTSADIQKKQLDTKNIWDSDKKFKYGVEYRVRELPRCIFLRDGSRKQKKKNTPQKKELVPQGMQYILDRAKFYLKNPPSSGVGYKKIFSYMTQKTPFGPEKKTTWSEIQISALTSIYDVLLGNQPVPQKKKSFLQESFFDNMPAYTLYDIPYLDTEDQRTDTGFALIKNILFEGLQKINPAYVEILAGKRILTKEGEAMLGIMGGDALDFMKFSLDIEIPGEFMKALENLDISLETVKGHHHVSGINFKQLIALIQYPARRKNPDHVRGFVCDRLRCTVMELLIKCHPRLLQQDIGFLDFIVGHFLQSFSGTTPFEQKKIELILEKYRTYLLRKSNLESDQEDSIHTQGYMKNLIEDFFFLFDHLELQRDMSKQSNKTILQKTYGKLIMNTLLEVFSRLKTGPSIRKSRWRREDANPIDATKDYLGIGSALESPELILGFQNMAYDYFTDDPRSVINKYKNLLTLSDLEQHKQYLTPEFYSLVKSTFDMSGVQKDRKQVTADGYADGKIQFLPTGGSTHLELKFVLVGNKNSQGYEHDDFYGYIAKNIDCFLRSRHIIHQDDIKAIILDAYQNSVYIQTQFGFDQQQAIESCMKYYKKKYIQVYHGPKKNEIFGWTSESARQKLIYMYGDAGSYTIEDKWKGGYTNRLPLDHHVKLYKKRLNNFLDTHDIKSDSEFDYASKMRIDSIQDIFDTLKKTYKAKPKNLSDQVFFDKIHKEICKNLTVDL